MKVRLLGCGTSSGVPRIGGDWGACDSANPKNNRTRASIIVETDKTSILVDTSPDMRSQLLSARIAQVDAIIWTHDHADHCHGIDDVRQIYHALGHPVAGYARPFTRTSLHQRFRYAFEGNAGYPPIIQLHELPDILKIGDIVVETVDMPHGGITTAGLIFSDGRNRIGYATDYSEINTEMIQHFRRLDIWVIDALRRQPHPTHPHLDMALDFIASCTPGRAILTHMDQSMDYETLSGELPSGIEPGYDGLEIALP